MKLKSIACALLALIVSGAGAQTYAVFGNKSCGVWLKERQEGGWGATVVQNWFMGYLSGRSFHLRGNPLSGLEGESAYLFLDNFCRANPLKKVDQAANALIDELASSRSK